MGKIPSALLRGIAHNHIDENPIYELWIWDVFMQRKSNEDEFQN